MIDSVAELDSDPKSKDYALGKTNYFELITDDMPKLRHGLLQWRFIGKAEDPSKPKIQLMVDRRWVTVLYTDGENVRKQDFQCVKRSHPVEILKEIFE